MAPSLAQGSGAAANGKLEANGKGRKVVGQDQLFDRAGEVKEVCADLSQVVGTFSDDDSFLMRFKNSSFHSSDVPTKAAIIG